MASLSSLAGGATYSVRLDPASAARIARLIAADARFQTYFLTAMRACVVKVQGSARDNASRRFANPTGNLLRNIQGYVASPYLGAVGVTPSVPYARRRELGFSGMTDRLGRYYPDDPGQYYLQDALKDNEAFIADTFKANTTCKTRSRTMRPSSPTRSRRRPCSPGTASRCRSRVVAGS